MCDVTGTVARLCALYAPSFLVPKPPPVPAPAAVPAGPNVLYLAYGSNLNSATFEGRRGIKPLSATVVTVPTLQLVFNLPGIAYLEPRVANVQPLDPSSRNPPLVGVVYEVTQTDYATIIATEGGGASYQDVLVDCIPISSSSAPIKAHTLLAPAVKTRAGPAQASARYLGLITVGAEERGLPEGYRSYLARFKPYRRTSVGQWVGCVLFAGLWIPVVLTALGISRCASGGEEGRAPGWVVRMNERVFKAMWWSYDNGFKGVFGDGERTDGEEVIEEGVFKEAVERGEKVGMRVEEMFVDAIGGEQTMESSVASLSASWEKA